MKGWRPVVRHRLVLQGIGTSFTVVAHAAPSPLLASSDATQLASLLWRLESSPQKATQLVLSLSEKLRDRLSEYYLACLTINQDSGVS
jgi:hypothetical protein